MMKKILTFTIVFFSLNSFGQTTIFENSNGKKTATYAETINFYLALERKFPSITVYEFGQTDSGFPLHVAVFDPKNGNQVKSSEIFSKNGKNLLLLNNGIHPGEPDGIDATMVLFRDLAENKIPLPKNTIIATIPIYNIGGA